MREMLNKAWLLGWRSFAESGKLVALLLVALLLFWFGGRDYRKRYDSLILYTTVMTICCICPLTAVVLMEYQTLFYEYQWIWNLVPVTIVISLCGTLLWTELVEKYSTQKGKTWKTIGITLVMLAVICLSGSMGRFDQESGTEREAPEETEKILERITENGQNTAISLWAPESVMEYARMLDGRIIMPYGRNMWEPALNAYAYDTYGEPEQALYEWMSSVENNIQGATESEADIEKRLAEGIDCMDMAKQLGVTHILLPENTEEELLEGLQDYLGLQAEKVEGYYLLTVQP